MSATFRNVMTFRVPWGSCDPGGVVHFSHWFRWFDLATWTFFEKAGLSIPDQMARFGTMGLPIVGIDAAAGAPAHAHDALAVTTGVSAWHSKIIAMHHVFRRGDTLVFEGHELRAWVVRDPENPGGIRAAVIPPEVVRHFGDLARVRGS